MTCQAVGCMAEATRFGDATLWSRKASIVIEVTLCAAHFDLIKLAIQP